MPSYDSSFTLFGAATQVVFNPQPAVVQGNEFFGLNGTQQLHGGTRETMIQVRGVLSGPTIDDVVGAEMLLNSYVDGIGRTFIDNFGRGYDNVVVAGYLTPDPIGIRPSSAGYSMPYTVLLKWLGGAS